MNVEIYTALHRSLCGAGGGDVFDACGDLT
jgi:hypothetical protein